MGKQRVMRLHVVSDLHQEFGEVDVPDVDSDCVILAGDIATKRHGLQWILRTFPSKPVIYICGNHEFYGDKHPRLIERLKEMASGTNVHVLENECVTIGSVHFFGCTLWTDFALHGHWIDGAREAGYEMNDFKRIRYSLEGFRRFTPRDARSLHLQSIDKMKSFFEMHDPKRSVVVTHHAPSPLSLPDSRKDRPISCAYASRLEPFILENHPGLWVHGHIHRSQDYRIGKTRIIANPRAYPDAPNPEFVPDLVINFEPGDSEISVS